MSRAVRRQQVAQKESAAARRQAQRLLGTRTPRQTRGARPPAQPRRRFRVGVPRWLEDIASELKKVTWPTRDETVYLTTVVIVVAVSVGILLGGIDLFFNWFMDRLLLR
ncbi:MAG TPA: preprotein translocase subunit SecE [Dehalococcoidia bacterium]